MITTRANAAEEEYFRREEADRRSDEAWDNLQQSVRANQAERERLKADRTRRCPECKIALVARTLRGVEIDQCDSCRGVWLDAGELEQLTQKAPGFLARLFARGHGGVEK
ncbi:MAG TPA: zf-TFIIB domain-containing protein [Polyangiaceae bacterium]|nr:zf-TFIIB domain-containing protein [Polyangiaceae bacterium]